MSVRPPKIAAGPIRRATWAVYGVLGFYAAVIHYLKKGLNDHRWPFALCTLLLGLSIFPTLLGVALGAVGALALGHVVSSLIYGVKPTDPITFLVVAFLLTVIALFASIIPAYRAAKVDPMVALRYE